MKKIFLSTEIKGDKSAWTKAKLDVARILDKAGYQSVYFPKMKSVGQVINFWKTLSAIVEKDSHLIVEFPFYPRIRMWVLSIFKMVYGVKVYAVIHDINDLRWIGRSQRSDMHFLKQFDGLISHNQKMTDWLRSKDYKKTIVNLQVFDYCLDQSKDFHQLGISDTLKVVYAGNLSFVKATYIYDKKIDELTGVELYVYGQHFEKNKINGSTVRYEGVFDPNKPELVDKYHFGLIWEGNSTDTCLGEYGQYIRFNNPHKFSLYLSLGLPVVVWKEAAIASFVTDHRIGVTIGSLAELNTLREKISVEEYNDMINNVGQLSPKIRNGFFLNQAVSELLN